jgi:O-antigen/teichoic acid export membrane protein
VLALIVILSLGTMLSKIALIPVAYQLVPRLKVSISYLDKGDFNRITTFGAATVVASICLAANSTGVRWLMNELESTSFVAHLSIMVMLGAMFSQFVRAATISIMPAASRYSSVDNYPMLHELILRGMMYLLLIVVVGVFFLTLFTTDILKMWLGNEFIFLSPYAVVIAVGEGILIMGSISHHMLKGIGKIRYVVYSYIAGMFIIPFSVIMLLYRNTGDPYLSVVTGLFIGNIATSSLQVIMCVKEIKLKFSVLVQRVLLMPITFAVAAGVIVLLWVDLGDMKSVTDKVIMFIIITSLYVISCYKYAFDSKEKKTIKEIFVFATKYIFASKYGKTIK